MNFEKIKFVHDPSGYLDVAEHVSKMAGVQFAQISSPVHQMYLEAAVLPKFEMVENDIEFLAAPLGEQNDPNFISIIEANDVADQIFRAYFEEKEKEIRNKILFECGINLLSIWGRSSPVDVVANGIAQDMPNELTITKNKEGAKIGIHLDTWEVENLDQRDRAMNRICVNLGPGSRFFIFCSTVMTDPKMQRGITIALNSGSTGYTRALSFLLKHDVIPLDFYVARVDPGQAYIAPTDLIFHDASTFGIHEGNVNFTYRGKFWREA